MSVTTFRHDLKAKLHYVNLLCNRLGIPGCESQAHIGLLKYLRYYAEMRHKYTNYDIYIVLNEGIGTSASVQSTATWGSWDVVGLRRYYNTSELFALLILWKLLCTPGELAWGCLPVITVLILFASTVSSRYWGLGGMWSNSDKQTQIDARR